MSPLAQLGQGRRPSAVDVSLPAPCPFIVSTYDLLFELNKEIGMLNEGETCLIGMFRHFLDSANDTYVLPLR
jgi:hypothetical protein